ncbi:MAG: lysine--tRNA ligase [Solirubrobacterales bacterium]|nr:lysine--tRNA ligase [Solirubrobacterales bacterium]
MTEPTAAEGEREPGDVFAERRDKLARLREQGVDPFPHAYERRVRSGLVRERHAGLEAGEETEISYRLAGRLTARRGQGKAAFLDLLDADGAIQLHARADALGADSLERLVRLDLGDLVGVEGTAFKTRRGELSLALTGWTLLAKSLRPPPDKFHGLRDTETRYRRRELDLIANASSRALFVKRARAVSAVREALDADGFLEVETPILQPLYGGALARPFTTHHNALDRDLYLRIATELYLKRLIVGGLERVYELGKDFRNEGVSPKHNPEFTMIEWYEAYADYGDAAARIENLVAAVAERVNGSTELVAGEATIDLAPPWRRVGMREEIAVRTGVDILEHRGRDELAAAVDFETDPAWGWAKLVDELFSRAVEPSLIEPTFVMDYPVELSPFAKGHRSEPCLVERHEAYIGGIEISNAFSELNDPDEQRRRFEAQAAEIARGDAEAHPYDELYVQALEQGMPPTAGVGLGIDRLVMILTGSPSLREVVLFPAMRD